MSFDVRVSSRAEADIEALSWFLAAQSVAAADKAIAAIEDGIRSLAEFPNRGVAGPVAEYRELRVPFGGSDFVLRYRVRGDEVIVPRVFSSRQPR